MFILGGLAGLLILMILPVMTSIASCAIYSEITGIHVKDFGPALGINVVVWFLLFGLAAWRSEMKARQRRKKIRESEWGQTLSDPPCKSDTPDRRDGRATRGTRYPTQGHTKA